jgi:hypothetical protein
MSAVTPEEVLQYTAPTEGFLCPLTENVYDVEFLAFKIRDAETGKVYFEVAKPQPDGPGIDYSQLDDSCRFIQYQFPAEVLSLNNIGTTLAFCVGNDAVSNFRMIERHYFRDRLLKSFDFTFPFCIPNSTNTWEAIYDVPPMSDAEKNEVIENPFESRSDSFYFVEDKLIMHTKAEYGYTQS